MPVSDGDPQDPSYRVKNVVEKYERVVRQSEISLSQQGQNPVLLIGAAGSTKQARWH